MAAPVLQFKRGLIANLPALKAGEPGFTTDGFDLFIGLDNNSANNKFFGSHRYWTKETSSTGSSVKVVEGTTNGTNSIALKSPDNLAGNLTYTLPGIQGAVSSVLTNDGSGNLSWASGSSNPVFTGISTFNTDQVDINSSVTISGITTIESTVDSTSKDTGALIVEGGVGIEKSVHIGAALSITTNLYVGGQSEFIGIVTFRGGTINLGDSGTDDVVIGGEFASDLIPTTDVLYNLGSSDKKWKDIFAKSLTLSGDINVTGFSTFNGLVVGNNGISVSGFSTIYNLHVLQDLNVNGSFDVDTSFTSSGNAIFSGITSFTDGTNSTNYDNGAVVIDGGVGIQKDVYIGGNLDVIGNVSVGGTTVTIRGQDVFIENKDIILGYTTSITPNDNTANHAGVAIASTEGSPLVSFTASGINTLPDTYKQMMWFKSGTLGFSTDAFGFNYGVAVGTTSMANGVRLAVGSGITMSDTEITASNFYGTFNGSFTGTVTGTASTATRATTVDTTATSTNTNYHLVFTDNATSTTGATMRVDAGIYYNPSSNYLFSSLFVGDVAAGTIKAADTTTAMTLANSTGNVTFNGDITVGGNDIKASDGTTAITLSATTGNVGLSSDLTINGNLFVKGSTTEVNTETLKVEDSLIEVGLINSGGSLVPPTSDLNIDVGVIFHYYTSSAKKAGVYWDDSVSRVVVSSDLSESSSVITSSTYAGFEIGSLWVNDCAGQSQVISCTGAERFLENITVDGGSF